MNAAPGAAILVSDPIDYFVKAKAEAIIPLPDNNRGLLSYPVLKEGESLLRVSTEPSVPAFIGQADKWVEKYTLSDRRRVSIVSSRQDKEAWRSLRFDRADTA